MQGSKSPDKKKSRTDEGIVEDDHAREDIHIRGLHNPSNSCYMNVVLQLLFLLEPISRNIMELAKASEQQDICSIIANALENLSSGLYDPYNPAGYHDAFAQFGFEKTVQEDAHEFLLMLLQKVGELGQDGVIGATLGFNVMKSFRCSNCGGEWKIEEPHRFLTLPITNSLKECIALYIRDGEILTKEMAEDAAEEATRECSDCLKSGFVMKGAGCFSKDLPPYLLFHLNRFERTQDRGIIKDNRPVSFQTDLDIKPYSEQPLNYKLRAVICHTSPSMDSGHYIIYVQPSGSQKWYLINDSTVREVNVAAVLTDQAYLLLYEKVEIDHKIGAGDGDGDEDEVKKGEEEMVVVVVEEEIEEALPVYWFPDEVSSSPELSTTGESRPESHHLRSTQPSTQPHKGIRAQSPAFPQSSSLSTVVREPTSGKWESWEEEKLIELLKKSVHIHKATWKENNFVFHWNYADIADSAELKMDPSGEPRGGRTAQQIYEKVYKRAYPAGKTAKKGSFESRVFEIIESEKKVRKCVISL